MTKWLASIVLGMLLGSGCRIAFQPEEDRWTGRDTVALVDSVLGNLAEALENER